MSSAAAESGTSLGDCPTRRVDAAAPGALLIAGALVGVAVLLPAAYLVDRRPRGPRPRVRLGVDSRTRGPGQHGLRSPPR